MFAPTVSNIVLLPAVKSKSVNAVKAVIVPPNEVAVPPIVTALFDKELFPIFEKVLLDPLIVLFVKVSVVALPTSVSVPVGKVIVPLLEILEIAGVVKVLFVNVSLPANVASVPVVGKVTFVAADVVKVTESSPEVIKSPDSVKSPPIVNVLAAFLGSIATALLAVKVVDPTAN